MTVAIDFDGVIHKYSRGWQRGIIYDEPMPGAIEGIKDILETESVVVLTARTNLKAVCDWLSARGIPCVTQDEWDTEGLRDRRQDLFWNDQSRVLVTNRKPPARVYLDDRGVTFTREGGWDRALQDMEITPAEIEHLYLVTVKIHKNPEHNSKAKRFGPCPTSGEPCTDTTGEHHTLLVRSSDGVDLVTKKARQKYGHVTRVESVPGPIPF